MDGDVSPAERAGFWRRLLALALDALIVGAALQIVGAIGYAATGGYLQSSGVIHYTECRTLPKLPGGITVPEEFHANFALDCTFSVFGLVSAHTLTIGRHTESGRAFSNVTITFLLDNRGMPITGLSLDLLLVPAIILCRWLLDRRRGTIGRRLLGVRLASALTPDAAGVPPAPLAKRYGLFVLPFAPASLLQLYAGLFPGFSLLDWLPPTLITVGVLGGLVELVAIGSVVQRADAFYDRLAGTMVVRVRSGRGTT